MNDADLNGRSDPRSDDIADPAALEAVRAYLGRWEAPAPDPAAKARLLTVLVAELPRVAAPVVPVRRRRTLHGALLLLWSQTRVVHTLLWVASALVIGLGALVSLFLQVGAVPALPFTLIAPVVAAVGVALLYGADSDPAVELVLATPVSPRTIVLARLALVFGFNLLLALGFSIGLALLRPDLSLGGLVLDWFAPMTLLSGLAFFASVLLFDPLASALLSLVAWSAIVARHFEILSVGDGMFQRLPDLLAANMQLPMIVTGLVVAALAVMRIEYEERWSHHA
ncbi:MAG: hypothetical protein IPK19_03640 [Chloroflexi bacterium]|nr:hypothetical protein [Chloroflexota bacterium]